MEQSTLPFYKSVYKRWVLFFLIKNVRYKPLFWPSDHYFKNITWMVENSYDSYIRIISEMKQYLELIFLCDPSNNSVCNLLQKGKPMQLPKALIVDTQCQNPTCPRNKEQKCNITYCSTCLHIQDSLINYLETKIILLQLKCMNHM